MTDAPNRADPLGDPDVSEFTPKPKQVPAAVRAEVHRTSVDNGYPSRPARPKKVKAQRRRITGRNVQLNIKATQETVELMNEIADRRGWVLGEVLEHALAALERG